MTRSNNRVSKIRLLLFPVLAGCCVFLSAETTRLFPLLLLIPYFLRGMRELPLKQKLFAYWLMSVSMNVGGYYWVSIVGQDYGGLPMIASWGLVVLYAMFNNIGYVLWAYLERFFGEKSNPFVIAGLFCVSEQLTPQLFPWYFGALLDAVPVLYQSADIFGVVGLSFVAMALIHFPYWLWDNRSRLLGEKKVAFFTHVGFLVLLLVYGGWALAKYDNDPGDSKKSVGVVLVQSNTSMEKFYGASLTRAERMEEFQEIVNITNEALDETDEKPDLVVWPEGSVHFPILNYPPVFQEISGLARDNGVTVTAGSVELGEKLPSGRRLIYNTQFVCDPSGRVSGKYRKIVLLAFGEYIPFLDKFPVLQKWLPSSISHFTKGKEKPVFQLRENVHWLPLICYEDIIPGFIDGFDYRKADFMVNITNDGWFGDSPASHLHKQMARPRSVEYRKPMVRTLNTGSSQVIDSAGRIISKQTDLYVRDFINVRLNLPAEPPVTIYSRIGHLPIYFGIAVVAVLWLRKRFFDNS